MYKLEKRRTWKGQGREIIFCLLYGGAVQISKFDTAGYEILGGSHFYDPEPNSNLSAAKETMLCNYPN